jgi:CubicO group peptidase (beta-lactamase class C family)
MRKLMLGFIVLLLGVNAATANDPMDPSLKDLRERWAKAMGTLRVPGLAVVVVRGDEVIHLDALGIRNPDGKKPVTPDTYFYIASCTKPYTAATAARLVQAGKLDLDAPVKRYLPRFELADADATAKLTVRDLLTHRPGLNTFPIVFLDAFTGEITDDRYYHFLKRAKPRGQVAYSNIHFTLAGRVLGAIEGKEWREVLRDQLFTPAGMTRTTGFASKMYSDPDAALPLEARGDGFVPCELRKTDRTMHAAGGLGTTARDLGRWLRLNLNDGRIDGTQILSPEIIKQMHALQTKAARNHPHPDMKIEGFGLGWMVGTYKGHRIVSHGGGYTGCAAFISFMPEHKLGVAVLANTDGAGSALAEVVMMDVYDRLLGNSNPDLMPKLHELAERHRAEAGKAPAAGPNPAEGKGLALSPAAYVGVYESEHWGTFRVAHQDGKLTAKMGDLPIPLKSTGTDRFQIDVGSQTWRDARFEVADGKVTAVVVIWNDHGEARFTRKGP